MFTHFLFSPRNLGKWSNLTVAYFSNGWFNHQLVDDPVFRPSNQQNTNRINQKKTCWIKMCIVRLKYNKFPCKLSPPKNKNCRNTCFRVGKYDSENQEGLTEDPQSSSVFESFNFVICWRRFFLHVWVVVSNIFYFQPYLGKIPILTNMFQMGWNHQLDVVGCM